MSKAISGVATLQAVDSLLGVIDVHTADCIKQSDTCTITQLVETCKKESPEIRQTLEGVPEGFHGLVIQLLQDSLIKSVQPTPAAENSRAATTQAPNKAGSSEKTEEGGSHFQWKPGQKKAEERKPEKQPTAEGESAISKAQNNTENENKTTSEATNKAGQRTFETKTDRSAAVNPFEVILKSPFE